MYKNILSVVNQKGGVGKTTTAVNLATIFAAMNYKTLLIDIDSQGNSTSGLGVSNVKYSVYDVLLGSKNAEDVILNTDVPNLTIMPSNIDLAAIEVDLHSLNNREFILKNIIDKFDKDKFAYIIIDCPPALNLLTVNALVACNEVLVPMLCDFYSMEGLSHLLKTIELIKTRLNPNLEINGVLFTMYDKRNLLTLQVESDVRSYLGDLVYDTKIPRNVKLAEAPSHGKAAIIYDHKCSGAVAYAALAREILERNK